MTAIREDSTWNDPEPGHSIVTHFQGQGHHLEVRGWVGGLGVGAERGLELHAWAVEWGSGDGCPRHSLEITAEVGQ